ncbi:50S ribosomal protein L25 [bacterium]|nr:50S ribosomal protein L25 [bacterium]
MNLMVRNRENTGKGYNRRLRQQGLTPGIIYGISDPQKISMRGDKAISFIKSMKGATKVFKLVFEDDGETKEKNVILQDYQISNLGTKLIHADFLEVTDNSIVTIEIPIRLINEGVCPAVKAGGVVQVIRRSVPIRCAVKDIPEFVEIDLIELEFDGSIHVLDLNYAEGVSPVVTGRNFTIVTIAGRTEEDEGVEESETIGGVEVNADADEKSKDETSS